MFFRDLSMITLTLHKTKGGYKLKFTVNLHEVALAIVLISQLFA